MLGMERKWAALMAGPLLSHLAESPLVFRMDAFRLTDFQAFTNPERTFRKELQKCNAVRKVLLFL